MNERPTAEKDALTWPSTYAEWHAFHRSIRALADPDFCPIPDDDPRGQAGWRFLQEHIEGVLRERVIPPDRG